MKITSIGQQKQDGEHEIKYIHAISVFNPLTPISDQDRISPYYYHYNINQISDENKEKYQFGDNKLIQYSVL